MAQIFLMVRCDTFSLKNWLSSLNTDFIIHPPHWRKSTIFDPTNNFAFLVMFA